MRSTFFASQLPPQSPAPAFKVVLLGNASVGKTSLINRFCLEHFNNAYQPSIGYPRQSRNITVDEQHVTLRLWEVNVERANQYGNAQRFAYEGAAAYIVLFDLTNMASFRAATEQVSLLQKTFYASCERGDIILAGTKSDLFNLRVVSDEQAQTFANQVGCRYFAISSKNNTNVDALFNHVGKMLLARPAEDQENDWVLVNDDVSHNGKLSTILADEIWLKSEGIMSKQKAGLKEMLVALNDRSKKSEDEYLEVIKKIAMTYSQEKNSLPFFSNAKKDTPLKAALQAIATASSLSDAEISVRKIKNQLSAVVEHHLLPGFALAE